MGYSERICQLCGIPFNIGRIRRPGNTTTHDYGVSVVTADGLRTDEPESAAWSNIGGTILFISDEEASEECSGMGCSSVARDQGDETEEEHLAGSNCVSEQGYSGWRISVEDMKVLDVTFNILFIPLTKADRISYGCNVSRLKKTTGG